MSTTQIKFEQSPAESIADSFVSTPRTTYPSLFPLDTMDPSEALTPPFDEDEDLFSQSRSVSVSETPAPEKKPTKKRKSWGQQLPEPKTNLPPRKRAKTEDEKEQRRVERVLRNRRAAQSSRERKRLEVEALEAEKREIERRNRDLELRLADAESKNLQLQQQIAQITGGNMAVFGQSSPIGQKTEPYRQPSPITLSKELFSSHDAPEPASFGPPLILSSQVKTEPQTVNPASVSPEIRPVGESSNASSSDMTQHPAVSVGRTTALDGFVTDDQFDLGNSIHTQPDYRHFFEFPGATLGDNAFIDNRDMSAGQQTNLDDNHLASYDAGFADFDFSDFITDSAHSALPQIQSENESVEKTAILQPPIGASSYGCDDGSNAVSV